MGARSAAARRSEVTPTGNAGPLATDAPPPITDPAECDGVGVAEPPPLPLAPVPPSTPVAPGLVSPAAVGADRPAVLVDERKATIGFGERRWRVRGLGKVTSFDLMRVRSRVDRW